MMKEEVDLEFATYISFFSLSLSLYIYRERERKEIQQDAAAALLTAACN